MTDFILFLFESNRTRLSAIIFLIVHIAGLGLLCYKEASDKEEKKFVVLLIILLTFILALIICSGYIGFILKMSSVGAL